MILVGEIIETVDGTAYIEYKVGSDVFRFPVPERVADKVIELDVDDTINEYCNRCLRLLAMYTIGGAILDALMEDKRVRHDYRDEYDEDIGEVAL